MTRIAAPGAMPGTRPGAGGGGPGRPASAGAGSFAPLVQGPPSPAGGSSVGSVLPIAAAGGLLALQDGVAAGMRRRRAARHAEALLVDLEGLHRALVDGRSAAGDLAGLRHRLAEREGDPVDPVLDGLLDAIELRAAVELAKLNG